MTEVVTAENVTPTPNVLDAIAQVADWRKELEQSIAALDQEISRLKEEARRRASLAQETVPTLQRLTNQGWECHWLELYEKSKSEIERFSGPEVLAGFARLEEAAAQQADDKLRRFPQRLHDVCRDFPPDPESRHPKYTFEDGFFTLEIDSRRRMSKLTDHGGVIAAIPADVEPLAERIHQERKRVFDRPLDAEALFRQVREGYNTARADMDAAVRSDSVPILSVVKHIRKAVKGFRLDEFIIDLSRAAAKRDLIVGGERMEFQHTRDTKDALLLHGPNLRGFVGYIVFRKETK